MKKIYSLFIASFLMLSSTLVQAANYDLNALANEFDNVNTTISVDADEAIDYFYFTDIFKFTITEAMNFEATALAASSEIESFGTITLFAENGDWLAKGDVLDLGANTSLISINENIASGNTSISAGTYLLKLTGWLAQDPDDSSIRGLDNATYDLTVPGIEYIAPVPEPSTYALMLAGLGLVGFMARRRRV